MSAGDKFMPGVYNCEIVGRYAIGTNVRRVVLRCPEIASSAQAGQFVNVTVSSGTDPLLRRPFSVHGTHPTDGLFSLLYVIVGRGTELLSRMEVGQSVSVVGPLGRGFDLGEDADAKHFVVAGGCGAAPLHFLCEALCNKWGCGGVTVLTGAQSKDAVLCEAEFMNHGVDIGISTDDGSYGFHGFVTGLLGERLATEDDCGRVRVYSCGPHVMMREVARISREFGVESCQVSLENNMACGIGVCTGCVQKVRGAAAGDTSGRDWHFERVCKDGPVFDAEDILWE
jgi:dihydroorotate dehydrogenase electron transfer subunit